MRLTNEEIQDICFKYDVQFLWSYSRYDAWRNSKYEWFLKYIKHEAPKGEPSPYAALGSAAHDIIDDWYAGNIKFEDMEDIFDTEFACNVDMLDLKFNRFDEEANKKLKLKYFENLIHFFRHAQKLPYKLVTEKPVIIEVAEGIVFQGYLDGVYKDDNGYYNILDFKTSSRFIGKSLDEHSDQLVLYAFGLSQMGISADKIKIAFEFLKYVTVKYQQVNLKITTTIIERRDIGSKLQAKARTWLNKLGYKEEAEKLLNQMLVENSIDCLPDDVKEKFVIEDCYVEVEDWQNKWIVLKDKIIETIYEIETRVQKYNETADETIFFDTDQELEENSYYLSNLSDYSIGQLKPFSIWLEKKEAEKEAAEDLLGVKKKDDDLDWLNEI